VREQPTPRDAAESGKGDGAVRRAPSTRVCEHSAGHDGDGMVPSACALECLLTQGPCLPRIWGGEPHANHHPRRQEEDSQPREEGQVVVARQGKGGEKGEVVGEDEQPRAGAELDERLHLAGLRHGSENSSRTARRLHTASTAREPCCRRAEAPAAPLRRRSARGEAASPCCSLRGRRSSTLRQATSPLRRRRSPPARATGLQETEGGSEGTAAAELWESACSSGVCVASKAAGR